MVRNVCKVVLGLLLVLVIAVAGCGEADQGAEPTQGEEFTMRMGHSMSPDAMTAHAAELLGKTVEARSDGRIKFEYFPGAQLGSAPEIIEQVRTGALEMSPNALMYFSEMVPYASALDLPFLWENSLDAWLAYHGPAMDMIEKDLEQAGWKVVGWTCYGPRDDCGQKPLLTAADYSGVKWRVPPSPIYVKTWEAWNAKPVSVPMGEVFTALEAGVVDGVSFDAETLLTQKFYEVAKYVTMSGWVHTFTPYTANKEWYDNLPRDLQDLIVECAEMNGDWLSVTIERLRWESAEKMEQLGATVNVLPPDEKAKLKEMVKPVYDYARQEYGDEFIDLLLGQ